MIRLSTVTGSTSPSASMWPLLDGASRRCARARTACGSSWGCAKAITTFACHMPAYACLGLRQGQAYAGMGQTEVVIDLIQGQLLPQPLLALAQGRHPPSHRGHMLADGQVEAVTVDRRITPPTAAPERRMRLSPHAAPQSPEASHAYRAGKSPGAPAFSRGGSVHAALADWQRAHHLDRH